MVFWIPTSQFKIVVDKEAAARKMAAAHMMAVAHMIGNWLRLSLIAIVGSVLAHMIAAVRMMFAEHGLPDYCNSHYSSASPPRIVL